MNREDNDMPWDRLTGLRNPESQANPANHLNFALTRLFLKAGLMLAENDQDAGCGPAFGWRKISKEQVVRRAMELAQEHGLTIDRKVKSGLGAFAQRWAHMTDYLRDLVTYALYSPRWREALELARRELLKGIDDVAAKRTNFSDLIVAVVTKDMSVRLRFMRCLIFQLALTVDSTYKSVAYEANLQFHEKYIQGWIGTYEEVLDRLGFKLRPGTTVDTLAIHFSSLAQGLALTATGTGDDSLICDDKNIPLLADGVMLIILGAIDRNDGLSTREAIDDLLD